MLAALPTHQPDPARRTVLSYNGHLDFGLIACHDMVPDIWTLTEYLHDALDELANPRTSAAARHDGVSAEG